MPEIHGNLAGIRQTTLNEIAELYAWPVGRDEFIPVELALRVCAYSQQLNREISVFIARDGEILDIAVGSDNQVQLPSLHLRRSLKKLSKVRCIHTHPGGTAHLSDVDMSAARSMWLDAMAAIGVSDQGKPTGISVAFLGEKVDGVPSLRLFPPISLYRLPQNAWMAEIEQSEKMVSLGDEAQENRPERALLVGIEHDASLDELESLCETAGATVVGRVLQKRQRPDGATYIGAGRAEQLSLEAQALECDLIVVDDELTAIQHNNLETATGIKVVDRTTLILDIFAGRATSAEGKLQVELAQLQYRSTHLIGSRQALSRLGGGIGTRGPGESKLEMDRRRIRDRMTDLRRRLDELEQQRALRRKQREKAGIPTVALVGYTNTGKSTLLNFVSGASVYAKDELFATLDAVAKKVESPDGMVFIMIDSVGFIRKLPTDLVRAFHSTLEEAVLADVLILVSDASNPEAGIQHEVVESVLEKLGATHQPRIEVMNKWDARLTDLPFMPDDAVCISAKTGDGVEALMNRIALCFQENEKNYEVLVPFHQYGLMNDLKQQGKILEEAHEDAGTRLRVRLKTEVKERLSVKWKGISFKRELCNQSSN